MIKFFRKIRQKLLGENHFSNYLLYAIGEIILVIVGILLALQINNWNENRVSKARIDSRLLNLTQDLEADIAEVQFNIKLAENRIVITKGILQAIGRRGTLSEVDRIFPELANREFTFEGIVNPNSSLSNLSTLDGNRSTYEALINAGEFHLISDQELAKKIQVYYAKADEFKDAERWNNMESYLMIYRSKLRLGLGSFSADGTMEKLIELASADEQFGAELEHSFLLDHNQYNNSEAMIERAEDLLLTIRKYCDYTSELDQKD